ncbi:Regulator of nonsense transcripts upf2, partial [Bonamia ostreae]
ITTIIISLKITKTDEINGLLRLCSLLNNEYTDFAENLEDLLIKEIDKEFSVFSKFQRRLGQGTEQPIDLNEFATKQRKNLRLLTEFVFVKIFEDDAILVETVQKFMKKELKDKTFVILSILSNFIKYAGEECTGKMSKSLRSCYKTVSTKPEKKPRVLEQSTFTELKKILLAFFARRFNKLKELKELKLFFYANFFS